jgi:hypothetical protein
MIAAVRVAEGWSTTNVLGAMVVLFAVVLAAFWAIHVTGRR